MEVKVFPKVDPCSLEPTGQEVNVGLRDEVLLLSLDFHVGEDVIFHVHQICLSGIEVLQ